MKIGKIIRCFLKDGSWRKIKRRWSSQMIPVLRNSNTLAGSFSFTSSSISSSSLLSLERSSIDDSFLKLDSRISATKNVQYKDSKNLELHCSHSTLTLIIGTDSMRGIIFIIYLNNWLYLNLYEDYLFGWAENLLFRQSLSELTEFILCCFIYSSQLIFLNADVL